MRWVTQEAEFKPFFLEARTCVYIDSGRIPTSLCRLVFDDAATCTLRFAEAVQFVMALSGDGACNYVVLDPDPVEFFHRVYGRYPVFEVARGDAPETFLEYLNEEAAGGTGGAVGVECWAWVVVPSSINWFVHALRDSADSGGHLWVPRAWVGAITARFPTFRDERWGPTCAAPAPAGGA